MIGKDLQAGPDFIGGVEHNANGLLWAIDNNMYTSEVDVDLRLKNSKFEVRKTLSRGQWGATQDDGGRIFRNTNESALHVDLVPARYFLRHPSPGMQKRPHPKQKISRLLHRPIIGLGQDASIRQLA